MIPKIIHRIWVGCPEPDWSQNLALQFQEMHPDWIVHTWTDEQVARLNLVCGDLYDKFATYKATYRADLLRVELVYRFGGVYVDADMEPWRHIGEFVRGHEAFCTPDADGWPGGAFFGAVAGHASMAALLDVFPDRFARKPDEYPHIMLGPHCWRDVFGTLDAPYKNLVRQCKHGLVCAGSIATAYPIHYNNRDTVWDAQVRASLSADTLMIHQFRASWLK